MIKLISILVILFSMVTIILSLVGTYILLTTTSDEVKEVDCYDRYNNKIIGQTCEYKVSNEGTAYLIIATLFLALAFISKIMGDVIYD